jgi:predicted transcriptional regulator
MVQGQQQAEDTMPGAQRSWTFLTNHAHVLLSLAIDPDMRLRDIATRVGITERATQIIVADLERSGYVIKERMGRRNRYTLVSGRHFRHPAEAGRSVDELVQIFT